MKEFFYELFAENGKVSMMRLLSLIVVIAGCILAFQAKDASLVLGMLGLGLGAKVGQKMVEK